MKRVISGAVAIPLVVGIVLYGPPWLFFALVSILMLIACHEYFSMISEVGIKGFPILSMVLSFFLLLVFSTDGRFAPEWGLLTLLSLFVAWFVRENNLRIAIDQISFSLLGILYVGGLSGYFLLLSDLENGRHLILFLFLVIWAGDSAAYYVGRSKGKKYLALKVSPGKTWEGAYAGVAGNLVAAILSKFWFLQTLSLVHCLIAALICGIIGQFGDLAESLLKRNTGVKDSGTLIPGHGGVLDRIDSLLFAGPALYCYCKLFL